MITNDNQINKFWLNLKQEKTNNVVIVSYSSSPTSIFLFVMRYTSACTKGGQGVHSPLIFMPNKKSFNRCVFTILIIFTFQARRSFAFWASRNV